MWRGRKEGRERGMGRERKEGGKRGREGGGKGRKGRKREEWGGEGRERISSSATANMDCLIV